MKPRKKALFLYTELAGYFLACVRELNKDMEVHIVRWEVNAEAPFAFEFDPDWKIYERNQYITKELIDLSEQIQPDVIICSGWIDEGYTSVAKHWMAKVPTVLSLDNHYTGSLRQRVGRLLSKFKLHNRFSDVWVPGEPQKVFAKKLGFKDEHIYDGFYSADADFFNELYEATHTIKQKKFPKRFLYVGRYLEFKGIRQLWSAFLKANEKMDDKDKWELWCVGTGELWEERVHADGIKHFGFLQAEEMREIVKNTGVFVLPSFKEPWGVVVHEMALAGFPMICSDSIGAASTFLKEGENGFIYANKDESSLEEALLKVMQLDKDALLEMAEKSHELGEKLSPEKWAAQVKKILA